MQHTNEGEGGLSQRSSVSVSDKPGAFFCTSTEHKAAGDVNRALLAVAPAVVVAAAAAAAAAVAVVIIN